MGTVCEMRKIVCPQCNAITAFEVEQNPTKTFTEVHKEFVKTQLTELQQYGSKAKRKRKA